MTISDLNIDDILHMGLVDSIKAECEKLTPNPLNIYCSVTGARIGELNDHAIWQLIQAQPKQIQDEILVGIEEIQQSCMLSMRPSPAWSIQTPERLKELVKRDPVGACVFYLTRAYHQNNRHAMARDSKCNGGINWQKWESKHAQAEFNWERVQMAEFLHSNIEKARLADLALSLCEVDGLGGLHTIPTPTKFLDTLLNSKGIQKLSEFYAKALDGLREQRRKAKLDAKRGNSLSRQTFNYVRPESDKPSKRQVKLAEKNQADKQFNDIWNELMGVETQADVIDQRKTLLNGAIPKAPKELVAAKAVKPTRLIKGRKLVLKRG